MDWIFSMGPVTMTSVSSCTSCLQREIKKCLSAEWHATCPLYPYYLLCSVHPGNPYRNMVNVVLSSLFHIWWRSGRQEKFKPENIWYQMQERRDFVCTMRIAFLAAYCNLCIPPLLVNQTMLAVLRRSYWRQKKWAQPLRSCYFGIRMDTSYGHGSRTKIHIGKQLPR